VFGSEFQGSVRSVNDVSVICEGTRTAATHMPLSVLTMNAAGNNEVDVLNDVNVFGKFIMPISVHTPHSFQFLG